MEPQVPDTLVEKARAAALNAYAPYSGFSVGCAVQSIDGEVAVGANMENACYRLGVCAEVAALSAAQQTFGLRNVARIAVAGGRRQTDGSLIGSGMVTSCGGCRQSIHEAAQVAGRDVEVIFASGDGGEMASMRISQLLPLAFGPEALG
jgi:cytidine deaminase